MLKAVNWQNQAIRKYALFYGFEAPR